MKKILFLMSLILLTQSAFSYDFSLNNRNYSYNEDELKFYRTQGGLNILMSEIEVQNLFPDYQIIKVSWFKDRKYTFKKGFKSKKVLLLNDTNRTFHGFEIYPTSSRDEFQKSFKIKSLITLYGKKDVRLKHNGGDEFKILVK